MIIRIVKMKFREDKVAEFSTFFEVRKEIIKSFPGCNHVELWQDSKEPNVFFTYSIWNSEEDLNHYRFSDFFKDTWTKTKALFEAKAEAWSVTSKSIA